MKKIGILTLQYALNYGGQLQCYALKEVLRKQGHDAVIIDRIPDAHGKKYVLKRAFAHPLTQKEFAGMRCHELRPMSKPVYSSEGLARLLRNYDACIVGSDQVWRKAVFSVNGDYFFQHLEMPSLKKIAYAASLGVSEWEYDSGETEAISKALSSFKAVSVREQDGVNLLRDHCGIHAQWVLDPTILADSAIYTPLIKKSKMDGNGKLVTYILDWTEEKKQIVQDIQQKIGKSRIDINPVVRKHQSLLNRVLHTGVTTYDWVKLISTADFVITDSFHGTAFSIIFNKQFYTIGNPERGMARFISILSLFGLQDRLIIQPISLNYEDIDYSSVNKKISHEREESMRFLINSLG